jgi:hypothetical protein
MCGVADGGQGMAVPGAASARAAAAPARAVGSVRVHVVIERAAGSPDVAARSGLPLSWNAFAFVRGRPAAWLAQRPGATLMRFAQRLVHLDLHAGSEDGGVTGWRFGDAITAQEAPLVIAGFNGGFKLNYEGGRALGFEANGRVAVPLKPGLASVVTYTDGTTGIGAWRHGVPDPRKHVFSVLQNLRLLVHGGAVPPTVTGCVIHCWGITITNHADVARSGLGITAAGQLVWAAGESLSPAALADSLLSAGAVQAIELDINPHWVAGYRYTHYAGGTTATPIVGGQQGVLGQFLTPYSRDFFVVVAN